VILFAYLRPDRGRTIGEKESGNEEGEEGKDEMLEAKML
jgi:hypothetical protein